jgi:glycosyltransferase involved in cell wall biosynthesis
MIHVAYCIHNISSGGAESHLLKVVRSIDRSRFKPFLFCLGNSHGMPLREGFMSAGVEIFDLKISGHLLSVDSLRKTLQLTQLLRGKNINIVHGYLYEGNIIGWLSGRLSGIPVISSRRSVDHYSRPLRVISKFCNRVSDGVTANSKAVADFMIREERCRPKKITLIPNGVATDVVPLSESEKNSVRHSWGIPEKAFVVGTVARFSWKKGYEHFVNAASHVIGKDPNVYFVSIGDGPMRGQIEELAKRLNLSSRVVFTGWQTEVQRKMSAFDVYVCASKIEGMSNALLEAMSQGLPVVATDVGGNRENVVPDVTGLLVPSEANGALGKAIMKLVDNPQLVYEMGKRGRERVVSHFSVEAMVRQMENLYLSLLGA